MKTLSIITQLVSVAFHRLLIFFFLILIVSSQIVAQSTRSSTDGSTPLGLAPGAPLGAYAISGFDNINPYNGHLNFRLPLLKTGGRGELNHNIALLIERKWRVRHDVDGFNQDHYSPDMNWWTGIEPGYGPGVMQFRLSGEGVQQCVSPPYDKFYNFTLTRLTFTASDGTEYELRDANTNGQPATVTISPPCSGSNASRGTVFKTADGSAATFVSDATIFDDSLLINGQPSGGGTFYPTGYLILRDGTRYRIENGLAIWIRDRNGNRMNFSYDSSSRVTSITDSLNRQVTISYNNPHVITFNGFGGNLRTTRVWHDTLQNRLRSGYSIQTYQQLFPQLNSASSSTQFNPSVVSSVELPDGRQYQFYYNSYGEIARVVLPTGGAFEYDYAAGVSGETLYNYITGTIIESMSGITAGGNEFEVYRRVTERRVYTNGLMLESKTVFSRPESYNSSTGYSTLGYVLVDQQDSGGTLLARAKHYYYGNSRSSLFQGATAYPGWKDAKEWKTEAQNTVSTVVKTTENTWQQPTATSNWPLTSAETSDAARPHNPMVTQTLMSLNDTSHVAKQTFTYDAHLNQTDVYEYDFGIGAPGAFVRRVQTNYLTAGYDTIVGGINNPNPADTIHIRSLPTQQSVYDGNGVEMARTTYEYDTAALGTLVDRPGITGLVSRSGQAAGAGYVPTTDTMRGNVTKVW